MNKHSRAATKKRGPEVYAEIDRIAKTYGLTAKHVEAAARDPKNPLHPFFEWDTTVAAYRYRLDQARELIASIVEREEGVLGGKPFRAYVNLRSGFTSDPTYHPIRFVMSRKAMRERLLAVALSEAESWMRRYKQFKELSVVFSAIRTAKKKKPKT